MNCCHLDISLENMAVQNSDFQVQSDGSYTINPQIRVKFIDFGLAEFFDRRHGGNIGGFECVKYCGKTQYKSPQVYREKVVFDARKSDVWSLGVVLFSLAIGAPPFQKPSPRDEAFQFIESAEIPQLLRSWRRQNYATARLVQLLHEMLSVDESQRFLMENVLRHPWLSIYYQQYSAKGKGTQTGTGSGTGFGTKTKSHLSTHSTHSTHSGVDQKAKRNRSKSLKSSSTSKASKDGVSKRKSLKSDRTLSAVYKH